MDTNTNNTKPFQRLQRYNDTIATYEKWIEDARKRNEGYQAKLDCVKKDEVYKDKYNEIVKLIAKNGNILSQCEETLSRMKATRDRYAKCIKPEEE